jgi:hypothetical protein
MTGNLRRTSVAIVLYASRYTRYRPRTRLRHQVTQQAVSVRSTRAEEILRPRVVMEPGRVTHAEQRAPDKPDRTSVGLFAIVPTFRNVGSRTPLRGSVSPCLTRCVRPFPLDYSFHHVSGPEPMRGRVENSASRPWRPEPALPTAHYHSSVNHLERRAQRQLNAHRH